MQPHADSRPRMLSLRALLSVALILLLSLSLAGMLEYLRSRELARQQADEVGRMFGRASAILIQPLVLADDRISLNFLFTELSAQPMISGLRLTAPDQTLIALAGEPHGRGHSLDLVQGEDVIGQLTYWTNPAPFERRLQRQLLETGVLLGGSLLLSALLLGLNLRRPPATEERAERPTFREYTRDLTPATARDTIPAFSFDAADSAPPPRPAAAPTAHRADFAPPEPAESAPEEAEIEAEVASLYGPRERPRERAPAAGGGDPPSPAPSPRADERREPAFDTDELVALLKPERDGGGMPSFTPPATPGDPPGSDYDEAMVPDTDEMELEERTAAAEEPPAPPNPLTLNEAAPWEPLGFERELELMLPPEEAGYLLLIDARSAHSDNVDEAERNALLKNYRLLANSVARIYSGDMETLSDGNLRLLFTNADDKDSHGINALCCAMLFTHLYQQYNQSQIRAFKPVINLQMALVRGARDQIERMQQEAHFLTRTTQSNALISHTALTEAPRLKESLLQQADIRREDEDKVLILSLNDAYQPLLEKQARHLLGKLNERQQGSQNAPSAS